MIKLSLQFFLVLILMSSNMLAKPDSYYYIDSRECSIAIPINFHILGSFTKKRIAFWQEGLPAKNIEILSGNQKQYIEWLKEEEKKGNNVLLEEKNIGNLIYQKYKVIITKDIFEVRHNIFGNDFFWGSNNVNQRDIDYMIKHCVETYKK